MVTLGYFGVAVFDVAPSRVVNGWFRADVHLSNWENFDIVG